jgi:hypothetical protein
MDRIMGVITLKAPVYRQIAEDQSATTTAAIIVAVVSVVAGVVGAVFLSALGASLPAAPGQSLNPIGFALRTIIAGLVGWVVGSWAMAFAAKTFFGGKTNTGEMLRVYGFASIFGIIALIPCLGIIAVILEIIAVIIGIREASEFTTGKAIMTGIVGFIVVLVVGWLIQAVLGIFGLG